MPAGAAGTEGTSVMAGRATFVDLLNEDLELEYRSIASYLQHIASVKGTQWHRWRRHRSSVGPVLSGGTVDGA
jgi:hypothetical protein